MPLKREDFDLSTGLADDFDGEISAKTKFGINKEYAAKSGVEEPMLLLVIDSPDIEGSIGQAYSLGVKKGWKIVDGGQGIVSEVNPDTHGFNIGSRGGTLVEAMLLAVGQGDKEKGKEFFAARGFLMIDARFYQGLNFHWKTQKRKTVAGEEKDVLLPDAFLGETKAAPAAKAAAASNLDDLVVKLSEGKTDRELKSAAVKDPVLSKDTAYMKDLVSGTKIADLEKAGKITRGPDGKFI